MSEDWEIHELELEQLGLLDPDQPTEGAHRRYVEKMEADFTPVERRLIRAALFGGGGEQP